MSGALFALAAVVLVVIALAVYGRLRGGGGPAPPRTGMGDGCIPGGTPCAPPLVCRPSSPGGAGVCRPPPGGGSPPPGGGSSPPGGGSPSPGESPGCPAIMPGVGGEGDGCNDSCECRVPYRCDLEVQKCVAGGVPGDPPPGCPAIMPGVGWGGDGCNSSCECRVPYSCDMEAQKCRD